MVNESNYQKVYLSIIATCLLFFTIALTGFGIQSHRLEQYMGECRWYREQLELAENRESEIRAVVNRTGEVLSETTTSVGKLREKLKEVEDSYNSLWSLLYDNDYYVSDRKEQVEEK